MNIFVGRLSYETQEKDLRDLFEGIGQVKSLKIITDRETGKSKGFAFVTMANSSDGAKAVADLNGASVDGRSIAVSEAEDRRAGDRKPPTSPGGIRPQREENKGFTKPSSPKEDAETDSDGWSPAPVKDAPGRKNSPKKGKEKPRSQSDDDGFRKKKLAPQSKPKKNRGWEDDLDDFGDFNYN
ncbi:MAG: RNA recognition motif-containing protein [Roseivirga sp.]|jgi:RNA recognition motif-containing protein